MKVERDSDLSNLNTFHVKARAKFLVEVSDERELPQLFTLPEFKNNERLFLGGGSNILFTKDFDGVVVLNKLKGIEIIEDSDEYVLIRAEGGEVWHDLVLYAVSRSLWGLENLSSIPGSVGAAPMQNIGAYGAELKEVLYSVEAYNIETGEKEVFQNNAYVHGYRESIFKNEFRGKYFISAITLKLSKIPKKNTSYKSLREYLEKNKTEEDTVLAISKAVTEIRKEKLPDPSVISNAGSFFKNIILDQKKFEEMLALYPDMPHYKEENGIKIPSGWLIEKCGWKGKREGDAGVYEKHALVLVNHGSATGQDIKNLAEKIIDSVYAKFGLRLVPEVNFI